MSDASQKQAEATPASIACDGRNGGSRVRTWIGLAAIAGLLFALMFSARLFRRGNQPHPAVGKTPATVDLQILTGQGRSLTRQELEGQITLINFWGPWCPPCRREMPHLVDLHDKYGSHEDFQLLLVSCSPNWQPLLPPAMEWREDVDALRSATERFLAREGYDITTYVDARGRTRDAIARLGGWSGYPTTLVLDRRGVIRKVWLGYLPGSEQDMEDRIRLLLRQRTTPDLR